MTEPLTSAAGQPLTDGQRVMLGIAATAMIGIGGLGAFGTYTNISSVFPHSATALGAVAAGEGATLILALVYVGLTMLGQAAPAAVRVGLWVLPAVASGTGAVVAPGPTAAVVYAFTPMAMCAAAEGSGLLARRIVIRTTGIDMEAQRRNAVTLQRLAYQQARAANHPSERVKKWARRRAWRLARKVGVGDAQLGERLVTVQRDRLSAGADIALAEMFARVTPGRDAIEAAPTDEPTAATDTVTDAPERAEIESPPAETVTPVTGTVTPPVTEEDTQATHKTNTPPPAVEPAAVTLAELAAVTGVTTPVTGETLSSDQISVVLRYLRFQSDPPLSYRQAVTAFRGLGFQGSEERVRKAWADFAPEDGDTPVR